MLVNPEGTDAGEELLKALDDTEQEPTDEVDAADVGAPEADDAADEADEDADLDEADADEGDEADEGTERYTVKVNGQEAKVSLTELKEGYMKDADYRRKTAELADTRKRTEAVEAEYKGGLETLEQQLTVVATFIASQMNIDEAEMDKLAAEKPAEFVKVQRQLAKHGNVLQNVHAQLQNVRKAQADATGRKMEEFRKAESAKLVEANPEFSKTETVQRLHSYLKDTYGLSQEDIESVADHRFALIADKARRFDAIKAKAALARQAQTDAAQKQAQYGVQSGGFEGDIARARVILNDPMSSEKDKAVAQAVLETAQRMQMTYDPVTGDARWNPKTQFGSSAPAQSAVPQPPSVNSAPISHPPSSTGEMLLPPPSGAEAPDAAMFAQPGTGNRKVDAALSQKAAELQMQNTADQLKAQQQKQTDLPKAVDQGNYMLNLIDQALNNPGLSESVGGPAGITGRIAETFPITQEQRDFAPIAQQLRGQSFLEAYQTLKGAGGISEAEGKKAESAISRLQQYQSVDSYKSALRDLKDIVQTSMNRAKDGASMTPGEQADKASAAKPVKRLRFNPQTGLLE